MGIVRQQSLQIPKAVTVVDDVITRGSTFVGAMPHLESLFGSIPIRCFALVRTMSFGDIQQLREPVEGVISYQHGNLHRQP